jgi:hypothetical protein
MIITIVADVFGVPNNGTTIAAMNLIRTLTAKGHTVRVICPDSGQEGSSPISTWFPLIYFGPFQPIVDHNGVVLAKPDMMTIARAIHDADEVHIMVPFFAGPRSAQNRQSDGQARLGGLPCPSRKRDGSFFQSDREQDRQQIGLPQFLSALL